MAFASNGVDNNERTVVATMNVNDTSWAVRYHTISMDMKAIRPN